ncbi:MAG: NAD+ synthase [Myxococcota bacterium]
MRIAIAQLDPIIGDLAGNVDRLLDSVKRAGEMGAELVVAPELAVTGYPPRDLLDRPSFVADARVATQRLAQAIGSPALLVGAIVSAQGEPLSISSAVANGALLLHDRRIVACHRKILLPTYDIFDEGRYFVPGDVPTVVHFAGQSLGISVCEDIWNDKRYWEQPRYARDPVAEEVALGAELLINVSASPYERGKPTERRRMLQAVAKRHARPILFANQVGGNDSILFDGRSAFFPAAGGAPHELGAFTADLQIVDTAAPVPYAPATFAPSSWETDVEAALVMGLRDYVHKCGFRDVVLGLSGGIDSALTAVIATQALGPEHVLGVAMPSRYSSQHSLDDAYELGRRLRIRVDTVPIETVFGAYLAALAAPFTGRAPDVTEENLQARIRGALLMAYSNKLGSLLLTTGNKSELAVGYATLYGDMCGGLAVISDLYKTDVYALARHINATRGGPIPESSLTKVPSAELRANQTDQDSLPPYDTLDAVLRGYIDERLGRDALLAAGHDTGLVTRIIRMVDRAEYKRRQMPPGLRVSRKAFGEGRRLPIAQRYSDA